MSGKPGCGGRPPHQPTDQLRMQVELMAAFGNTVEQICQILGISDRTLRVKYHSELATGHLKANNKVATNIFRQAIKDDLRAFPWAKFWMNTRAGWSEYAPSDAADKLGKKEIAQIEAQTAEAGTGWAHLVH